MSCTPLRAAVTAALLLAVSGPARSATDTASQTTPPRSPAAGVNGPGRAVEIVVLFRSDCAPCRHELDILPHIAARYPDLALTLLVLQDDGMAARLGETGAANLRIRKADGAAEAIMARYGDARRGLPFSAALDATGRICARHYGLLGLDMVGRWRAAC